MQVDQIRSIPLFEGLTDDELADCASMLTEFELVAGSSLAKQDDFAYKFFIVLDGEVDVHRDFELIDTMGPGEFFGETGIVKGEKRNARVTTKSRCRIACMMGWDLKELMERLPTVASQVDAKITERNS